MYVKMDLINYSMVHTHGGILYSSKKETKALPVLIWKDFQSILLSEEEEDVEQDIHSALCAIKGKIRSYINICLYGGRGGQCNGWEQSGRKIDLGMIFFQHFYFEPFEFVNLF